LYTNKSAGFEKNYSNWNIGFDLSAKPTNYLRLSFNPGYNKSFTDLQYITETNYNSQKRYIFGYISRNTFNASIRVNLNLSPDLTLQYWGQPFIATGKYSKYKYITDPMADDYKERFHIYTDDQISYDSGNFNIDENMDGTTDYGFEKRDFNVQEFLSNLVVRWEFNPGSSVYLVWSQSRNSFNDSGQMDFFDDMGDLFNGKDNKPHNVFLVKFSYRFGLR